MASQVARDASIVLERLAYRLNQAGARQELLDQFAQLASNVRDAELPLAEQIEQLGRRGLPNHEQASTVDYACGVPTGGDSTCKRVVRDG